ncbi:ribonuclease HII [Staphylococcus intermedius]|uniref:Ribonuclease HII n=1 Tax=Staphylococcus intermedius NCTC 11048 TaxID=1141106 RepID=A0A380G8T8_STAIN|nr:ribonuclease HII [Staphylococcus intermedius]PCF65079.1 ribonuclease HII [Staphylococcus intermedius]PCF80690.1 ribonuclease HII [Staphylococcus intermedius]PCF82039.1 ribonuclease HII [Staphylococcus intermedius]PCF88375.1 ribonuclease HII [Staphylococcus intermedius]PCF89090.1 ribonuclease HII [Staphylococcus intermedius]
MRKGKTIQAIKEELQLVTTLEDLAQHPDFQDARKGVQQAFLQRQRQLEKIVLQKQKYRDMCQYETEILNANPEALICGVDEVGRGPLAGPVVASAVVLQPEHDFVGINDSKQLSATQRDLLNTALKAQVRAWAVGIATPEEIDAHNIYVATQIAMYRAIENLAVTPTHYLIDAMKLDQLTASQQAIIKGDAKSVSIAAASIIAKVYRDDLMAEYAERYPGYDFAQNAGYGTQKHLDGLKQYGVTPIHRKSFEPIKSMVSKL